MKKWIIILTSILFIVIFIILAFYFILSFTSKSEAEYLDNKAIALTQVPVISDTCINGSEQEDINHELEDFEYNSVIGSINFIRLETLIPVLYGDPSDKLETSLDSGGALDSLGGLPLSGDSTVIAGHKNSDFEQLEFIKNDDKIKLNIDGNIYLYEVYDTEVTDENDLGALFYKGNDLVIYTCFPFTHLDHYTQRFVVHAKNISSITCT